MSEFDPRWGGGRGGSISQKILKFKTFGIICWGGVRHKLFLIILSLFRKAHLQTLRALVTLLHEENFVVCVGGGGWAIKVDSGSKN